MKIKVKVISLGIKKVYESMMQYCISYMPENEI